MSQALSAKQRKILNNLPYYEPAFRKGQIGAKDGGDIMLGDIIEGRIGLYGSFRVNHDATIQGSLGDIVAVPDSGGAAGTYRVLLSTVLDPQINQHVKSIDWVSVQGFTPRNPTTAETDTALVTGFNFDTTLKQWYITVQIVALSTYAVDATPPANFTIGVRLAVTLNPLLPSEQV